MISIYKQMHDNAMIPPLPKEHPLKNPDSSHYDLWDGMDAITVLEGCLTTDELIGWCKGNILKYRLRIGRKGDLNGTIKKIETYENYLAYLMKEKETT